jgi:hypothetical protein
VIVVADRVVAGHVIVVVGYAVVVIRLSSPTMFLLQCNRAGKM